MLRRLQGLVSLHIWATTLSATLYYLALIIVVPRLLPRIDLSETGLRYSLAVVLGMLLSSRSWQRSSYKLQAISWHEAASRAAKQISIVALLMFGFIVATKDRSVSRLFLSGYLLTAWMLLTWLNRTFPRRLAQLAFHSSHQVPAIVVGDPQALREMRDWFKQGESLGISIVGLASDHEPAPSDLDGIEWVGPLQRLPSAIATRDVGQLIVSEMPKDSAETLRLLEMCQAAGCRLLIRQNWWGNLPVPMSPILEGRHLFLTLNDEPLEDPLNRAVKRIFDIAVSLPIVVLVLPPLCLLVLAMQAIQAPGPLLFKRLRGGHRRRAFGMLKFRSMYATPADAAAEARQARQGDARIYPFGAFLRKTSLDEFPQFFNVLVGQMSVVGPRPHLPLHDEEFSIVERAYRTRHLVKPGVTGLAQVSGFRGEITDQTALRRRVELDIEYITSWSIWLDLQITLRTLLQVFRPPRSAR